MNSIQSHDKQLHIYITVPNTLKKDGILSPSLVSEKELQHYADRAGSKKKTDIIKYLDSTFPGRSRSISVLTEPIPDTAAPKFLEFRNESQHVILPPIEQLKKLKLIDEVRLCKKPYPVVPHPDYKKIDWSKNPTNLLFKDITHYQLVLTTGKIPPNVIEIDEIKHSQESKDIAMLDDYHIDLSNEPDRKTVLEKLLLVENATKRVSINNSIEDIDPMDAIMHLRPERPQSPARDFQLARGFVLRNVPNLSNPTQFLTHTHQTE